VNRFFRSWGLWLLVACLAAGCDRAPAPQSQAPATPVITAVATAAPPGVVELISATGRLNAENIVRFEVAYRFTSGSPTKNYMCEFAFPGTNDRGVKPLDAWEVKPEGVIQTGIQVSDESVKEYSITFSEADSPDRGYKVISNTLTGEVEPPAEAK
jgi:hypothetical protein